LEAASSEFEQSKRLEYLALGFCHGGVNGSHPESTLSNRNTGRMCILTRNAAAEAPENFRHKVVAKTQPAL
jgi:hypothetical protein